jgi:hypothetical protein
MLLPMSDSTSKAHSEAQQGLELIKQAIRRLLAENAAGLTNYEIAQALGLETSFSGSHKNYLTYVVLRQMVQDAELVTRTSGKNRFYVPATK